MKQIAIIGAGGFGREVLQIIQDINEILNCWEVVGWIDDSPERANTVVHGHAVLGNTQWLAQHPEVHVVVAVGGTSTRRRIVEKLHGMGHRNFATLLHPRAWVGRNVGIGEGSVIASGTQITCDIEIGAHAILNLNCTVGHDTIIGDFVTLNPATNVSGNVKIATGCEFGTNGAILPGVSVGEWVIVGAGTLLNKPVPPNVTIVGVPGKIIKERPVGWHLE